MLTDRYSMASLVREVLKNECMIDRNNVSLHDSDSLSNDLIGLAKLEGQVELIEVLDCGSIGGFGHGQGKFSSSLEGRIKYLKCKYIKKDITLFE
ncbi:hypothetical protein VPHD264_0198 [Vibrio phage D264]